MVVRGFSLSGLWRMVGGKPLGVFKNGGEVDRDRGQFCRGHLCKGYFNDFVSPVILKEEGAVREHEVEGEGGGGREAGL